MVKIQKLYSKSRMLHISAITVLLATSKMLLADDDANAWNQVLALKDKSPTASTAIGTKQYADAIAYVSQIIEDQGSSAVLRLLNSTSQDDYLRQASIAGALKATYTYQDLPNLCAAERILSTLPSSVHARDRHWISPEVAQLRIADWIEYLLGISDNEKIGRSELLANVNSWIYKTVGVARNHSAHVSDADVLTRCLSK